MFHPIKVARAQARRVGKVVLDSYHTTYGAQKIYRAQGFRNVGLPKRFPAEFRDVVVFIGMDVTWAPPERAWPMGPSGSH